MVSLQQVRASNGQIAGAFSSKLVAVFVGATSGVGKTTLLQFAKHASKPRVYFVGRSEEAGRLIKAECEALNPGGEFIFIQRDTSLLKNVDSISEELKKKEKYVNLLFLTMGSLQTGLTTEEGLHYAAALVLFCRHRFISNLLPLIELAPSLRRVITVFVATMEGPIDKTNLQCWNRNLMSARGHAASVASLALEKHAKDCPTVSFIHNFPGPVKSGLARGTGGLFGAIIRGVFGVFGSLLQMPFEDAGDRHVFLATSSKYPAREALGNVEGIELASGVEVAKGTDGKIGSGVYSIDMLGESAKDAVYAVLSQHRKDRMVEWIWNEFDNEFLRVTGRR